MAYFSTLLWMIRKYFIRVYDDKVNSASFGLEMAYFSTLLWMIRKYFIRVYDNKVNSASFGLEMASFHFTLDDI